MTLPITPAMLEAAYEYLRRCRPFAGWKLPPGEEVEFHVTRHRDRTGDHCLYKRTTDHVIRVSTARVATTDALMQVMGHEMIHGYQDGVRHTGSAKTEHNAEFKRLALRACRIHGWGYEGFVA